MVTRRRVRVKRARPPRLNVSCVRTETSLEVKVSPRKRNARLRSVVGPRLRLGVGRGRSEPGQAGDWLTVTSVPAPGAAR